MKIKPFKAMNIDKKTNSKRLTFKTLLLFTYGIFIFASCTESTTPPDPEPSSDFIEENTHLESDSVPLISSFNFDPYPTYDSIKSYLKTGDILLFEKFDTAGVLIEALEEFETLPKFTHVGIVFKLPAKGDFPEGLYFWQAVPPPTVEPMNYGPDYFKGAISDGAQMVSLDSIMAQLSNQKGMGLGQMFVWVRQLTEQLSSE